MPNKPTTPPKSEKKSHAAEKLGGQPENDQDARDAGVESATSPKKPKQSESADK